MSVPADIVLATDSPDPSGVGVHMLTLAAALPDPWRPRLCFAANPSAARFVQRARDSGLDARIVEARIVEARIVEARIVEARIVEDWDAAFAGADLVHVHAGIAWEGHELVRAARTAGAKVVRTEHLPMVVTDADQLRAYSDMLRDVDAVIAVSRASALGWQRAIGVGPSVTCIPNGVVDPGLRRGSDDPGRPATLLCVARFTAQKNHDVLIDAMALMAAGDPHTRLILVGDGPEAAQIRARVEAAGLGDRVTFAGPCDDVPGRMAQADLLVLASAFEGLPLVVLEAMAAGLPVVATRIGGVVEALGPDHPWLVPPGDAPALATALTAALRDQDARTRAAGLQRQRYDASYSAVRMGADTARLYDRLSDRRPKEASMTKTRLGFIGAGGIAHRHFGVLDGMEDVAITAIADTDPDRARDVAAARGACAFTDVDAMLEAEDLDAVYICVPPFAHGAAERACIARGLPFFVEKPLSLDLDLAEAIAVEVEQAGLITATGYHWRYLDTVDEARRRLADNPAHLMTGFWLDATPPPQWWWRNDGSGGQIVEQATHLIDLARFLAGDVVEVQAMAARRDRAGFEGLDVPTATTATLRFAGGAIATLSATCLLGWNHRVGLHVFADRMAMEITDHDIMIDTGHGRPVRGADGDPVWREDRDFIDAVRGGENRIRAPYAEALATHRVALAVARAATTGDTQTMEAPRSDPRPPFCSGGAMAPAQDASLAL